ncbi:MAG: universal stress protein [Chthonomonadales bacterium]|nr:universal stress protein [Chthonomonadales bacterium]
MIVYTKEDMVRLSGALVKNQWLTIKAAANLLLRDHPQGILIDGSELEHVSEDGARTFLEAMRDIQAAGARIVVCNLPANVLEVLRGVPGVRSQLPIANSVEEARDSLRMLGTGVTEVSHNAVLVPLLDGIDVEHAIRIAGRVAQAERHPLVLLGFLEVARTLPLGTPLPEAEASAKTLLESAAALARRSGLPNRVHLERVRDLQDGVLHAIRSYGSAHVVLAVEPLRANDELFANIMDALLHRAPCDVVIARRAIEVGADAGGAVE